MKRYIEYKSTKYDWLPQVPIHWVKKTIRSITELSSERRGNRQATLLSVYREYGVIKKSSRNDNHNVESEDLSGYKIVRIGDLVLNKMKMWQGSLGVSEYDGIVSPAYIVCHITESSTNRRYLHMLLRSAMFKTYYNRVSYGVRVGQWDMHYTDFKSLELFLPPRSEQDQIVRYLDWQVSKINKLIAAKKKEIAVLEEYKQTAIDEAVTKGISNHDFVTSNVDWIEQIPSSWKLKKIKVYFSFGKGLSITKANLVEEGIPVISYGQVHSKRNTGVKVEQHLLRYVPDTYLELSPNALVNKGDFIFADTSEDYLGVGNCVYIDVTNTLFAGYHTIIARSKHNENGKFFAYLFRSSAWRYQIRKRVNGVKVYSITQKILGTASVLIPPKNEQAEIVEYLDDICGRVDAIIENLYKRIDIFHEYRTRLISDVVTGQIDVRGIEIPDYEYVEEESDEETDETEGADEEVEEQEE